MRIPMPTKVLAKALSVDSIVRKTPSFSLLLLRRMESLRRFSEREPTLFDHLTVASGFVVRKGSSDETSQLTNSISLLSIMNIKGTDGISHSRRFGRLLNQVNHLVSVVVLLKFVSLLAS
ncbi:uncharacterized protein TrAFT101_006585 [Trichoderma asperellum]|uniref:uncharacterized protein n=1 Tax=Trichoderma asperellum TaxID=101201 RepID=UPI00332AF072|nr:hypothetical protein TrAFT101_006585 [Trichoderma asperellum]